MGVSGLPSCKYELSKLDEIVQTLFKSKFARIREF